MRKLRYYQVDAFTSERFRGNPAGVCLLEGDWLPAELMQRIAFENNLAETAFVLPQENSISIRWFTPTVEIDLCGHATLASAFILFTEHGHTGAEIEFQSKSGILKVARHLDRYVLDFPARHGEPVTAPPELIEGLGRMPREIFKARDWMVIFDSEQDIRSLNPRFDILAKIPGMVITTAPGNDCDFVSRFFAPGVGVNEDPVTGSSHCTLIPYWSTRLDKRNLHARQLSARGGELFCELRGDRVGIGGHAILYSSGHLHV